MHIQRHLEPPPLCFKLRLLKKNYVALSVRKQYWIQNKISGLSQPIYELENVNLTHIIVDSSFLVF